MLELFTLIIVLVLLSKLFEAQLNLPFVLVLITLAVAADAIVDLSLLGEHFHEILYLMLPVILIPDVLGLSRHDLRAHGKEIAYLAVVAVVISIALAVGITCLIDTRYSVTTLLLLFAPLMATDVVSVSAIFGKFRLPERLKLYAEGESLFNDITAMIIFFFIALPFAGGEATALAAMPVKVLGTIAFSLALGIGLGLLGYALFKYFDDSFQQFLSIYAMAGLSMLMAEELHLSGMLSVVISLIVFKYFFDREGHYHRIDYNRLLQSLNAPSSSLTSFRAYRKEAYYLALFANALIFVALANVVSPSQLLTYIDEILYVFVLTTAIRYLMMLPMIRYKGLPIHWATVLTLSGMKGGLAIIMIVSLPASFEARSPLLSIVVGVVLLSIFVYTALLILYLARFRDVLLLDKARDADPGIHDVRELFKREAVSGAYHEVLFEELVEKEIHRVQRYSDSFALVAFRHRDPALIGRMRTDLLRGSDALGRIAPNTYAVLLAHCDLDGAMIFVGRLQKEIGQVHIAVAEYATGDTVEMLYDKLQSALHSDKQVSFEV